MKNQKDDLDLKNVVQCCPEDPNLNLIGVLTFCDLKKRDFSGKKANFCAVNKPGIFKFTEPTLNPNFFVGKARRLGVSTIITNIDLKSRGCYP